MHQIHGMRLLCRAMRRSSGGLVLTLLIAILPIHTARADVCDEPNDQPLTACYLPSGAVVLGVISSAEDRDAYRIEVPPESTRVRIELTDLPADADYDLALVDQTGQVLGQSAQEGAVAERLDLTMPAAGNYFVYVWAAPGRPFNPNAPYTLSLTLGPASSSSADSPTGGDTTQPADSANPTGAPTVTTPAAARVGQIYFSLDPDGSRRADTSINVLHSSNLLVYTFFDYYDVYPPNNLKTYLLRDKASVGLESGEPAAQAFVPSSPTGWASGRVIDVAPRASGGAYTLVVELNGQEAARADLLVMQH